MILVSLIKMFLTLQVPRKAVLTVRHTGFKLENSSLNEDTSQVLVLLVFVVKLVEHSASSLEVEACFFLQNQVPKKISFCS